MSKDNRKRRPSKYKPRQGPRECARRVRQLRRRAGLPDEFAPAQDDAA